ncbi:hypothetical protein [Nonomuraea sp. NPDC048826]|uniref:hypothetical protein n=1 Tax=Nonomuraea sp. NPDC048826 TaxID=3364347 RepID=UPI0037226734
MSEMDVRGDDDNFADDEELPIEAPAADAAEQQRPLRENDDRLRRELPLEVNPADAVEQDRVVEYDDDDYR